MEKLKKYLLNRRIKSIFKGERSLNEILDALWNAKIPPLDVLLSMRKFRKMTFPEIVDVMKFNDNWREWAEASERMTNEFFDELESCESNEDA